MPVDKLTDVTIRKVKPGTKAVRLAAGAGLYLEIAPTNSDVIVLARCLEHAASVDVRAQMKR